jgi:hypothetical protein
MQRRLRDILALPQTATEERIADRHIRREAAKIRETWSEREYLKRAGLDPDERVEFPAVHIGLAGIPPGR